MVLSGRRVGKIRLGVAVAALVYLALVADAGKLPLGEYLGLVPSVDEAALLDPA